MCTLQVGTRIVRVELKKPHAPSVWLIRRASYVICKELRRFSMKPIFHWAERVCEILA